MMMMVPSDSNNNVVEDEILSIAADRQMTKKLALLGNRLFSQPFYSRIGMERIVDYDVIALMYDVCCMMYSMCVLMRKQWR